MTGALPIVKQGGTIILAASLTEGIGSPEFQQLFSENADLEVFVERILGKDYFVMDQWQLEELAKVRRKAQGEDRQRRLAGRNAQRPVRRSRRERRTGRGRSLAEYGPQATLAVIPKGPYVLAKWVDGECNTGVLAYSLYCARLSLLH